jgi:hypothetical protein
MVNAIAGFQLSGENDGELSALKAIFDARMRRARDQLHFGRRSRMRRRVRLRELLSTQDWLWESNRHLNATATTTATPKVTSYPIVGFKEIIWTPETALFLQEVAPCSRFILNMRKNTAAQVRSAFFSEHPSSLKRVMEQNDLVRAAIKTVPPGRVFRIDLEDFSAEAFTALARWLGVGCEFRAVAHFNLNGTYEASNSVPCIPVPTI